MYRIQTILEMLSSANYLKPVKAVRLVIKPVFGPTMIVMVGCLPFNKS